MNTFIEEITENKKINPQKMLFPFRNNKYHKNTYKYITNKHIKV